MRRGLVLAAALVACGLATPAAAVCTEATGRLTELPLGGDPCVAGAVRAGEQSVLRWTVAQGGPWHVTIEALPGSAGAIGVVDGDGNPVWQGTIGAEGTVQSPDLLLATGPHDILLTTAGEVMLYRLRLEAGEAAPPAQGTLAFAGAFEGAATGTDEGMTITWDLAEARPGELWTFEAQSAGPRPSSFELYGPDGALVLSTSSPDDAGIYRLPDLLLAPGQYQLSLGSVPAGTPIEVRAHAETQPPEFAFEPDDTEAAAHLITPGIPATGRLATNGTFAEGDQFALDLPADAGLRRYDVVLLTSLDADLTLAIVDADGGALLQRTDSRTVALRDIILGPGRHLIRVSGSLPLDAIYSVTVEDAGTPATSVEVEPNDDARVATPLDGREVIAGAFDGDDRDYIAFDVTGDLQLWTIEVTGEAITRLTLEDGAGAEIAAATPEPGSPVVRMSRMLLPAGANVVRIDGVSGTWLLRAEPLGPPADGVEIEPNDDPARALVLPEGALQTGWLDRIDDPDLYAFHLDAPHRVTLTLDGPADFPIAVNVSWGEQGATIGEATTRGLDGQPQRLVWQALLQPGDYLVALRPVAGLGRDAYGLSLTFPPYFDRPVDLEPNGEAWQAQRVAPGQAIEGDLYGDDADWFELDPALGPGVVTLRAESIEGYLYLRVARGDPASPETVADLYVYQSGETATVEVPAGERTFLQVSGTAGRYVLTTGGKAHPAAAPPAVAVQLAFDAAPVAAFAAVAQRLAGTLTIQSRAGEAMTLDLRAWLGDERWRLEGVPDEVVLPAGEQATLAVALEIPADVPDGVVPIDVGAGRDGGAIVSGRAAVTVATGVLPVGPHRFAPYPPTMLGGLDVAWTALGSTVDDPTFANLFDGVVDAAGIALWPDYLPVVRLAGGGAPVPITGVILFPPADNMPSERLADFAIEVSTDGTSYRRVLEARLSPLAREQAFAFAAPVEAAVVRLVPLSAQGGPGVSGPRLAELQVIADPAFELEPGGFNIATPARGGHIVRTIGTGDQDLTGENAAWPADYGVAINREEAGPVEWVLGFLDSRAARVARLRWNEAPDTPVEERIAEVGVEASADGPLGPWTSLGAWRVAEGQDLVFGDAPWIRSLRFRVIAPAAGRVWLPANIEVQEAPGLSILGAWGDLARTGPYEAQQPDAVALAPAVAVSADPAAPTPLALGETAAGQLTRGLVEHWYAVDLPEGTRTITASFDNRLAPDVAVALVGDDGREIALQPDSRNPGVLMAEAGPGRWRVHVTQPIASVVVSWDTSLSVSTYYPAIARMIRRIGWQLDPAREAINLLPFRGEVSQFLMDDWSGEPAAIYAALHAYPMTDTSSDAENALLYAALRLNERVGTRAIVVATDASYSGVHLNEPLWQALEQGGIRIFTLHFPVEFDGPRALAQVDLMQDWASAAGGYMSRFASQADGELAFRRLAAWLDRPADYSFVLAADTTPPEPGTLTVRLEEAPAAASPGAVAGRAMAIILDASGSMLQRLGETRRIDIAKDVLRDLGRSVLPEGMPVALRVFGNDQPGSCENTLFVPLGPLDREAFVAAVDQVQSVNLARTSIAATLEAAAGDLAGVEGPKTIVLVTDGEETCGGDPLAVIRDLRASGIDVRLNIVGFAIDDAATRQLFEEWAEAGAGAYFEAGDREALAVAVTRATTVAFTVLDDAGNEVARGTVDGAAVPLPAGAYRLRIGDAIETRQIAIRPGEAAEITVAAPGAPPPDAPVAPPIASVPEIVPQSATVVPTAASAVPAAAEQGPPAAGAGGTAHRAGRAAEGRGMRR